MPRRSIYNNCTKIAPQHLDTDELDKKKFGVGGRGRRRYLFYFMFNFNLLLLKLFSLTGTVSTSPNLAKERARRASKQFFNQ